MPACIAISNALAFCGRGSFALLRLRVLKKLVLAQLSPNSEASNELFTKLLQG